MEKHWITPATIVLLGSLFITSRAHAQTVTIGSGVIEGISAGELSAYRGIPFAMPPIGQLRWRPPQPPASWTGVRRATTFAPACPQHLPASFGPDPRQSEDCLYLNVWEPTGVTPGSKLPVMVWIYGGGFTMGDAAGAGNDLSNLARHGVVAVNFNYRLGRLGWFTTTALSQEAGATGSANYGFMDQLAALRWVQHNIAAFGGDPSNVTVFGTSAGGVSVELLMISPAARGLFAKAITQSGFGRLPLQSLSVATAEGDAFTKAQGITDLAALRALPVERVIAPVPEQVESNTESTFPILDGELVPDQIASAFAERKQVPVPWIVGSNSYEASLVSRILLDPDRKVFTHIPILLRPLVRRIFDFNHDRNQTEVAANLVTDSIMTEPARFLARAQTRTGAPVYRYFFDYVPSKKRAMAPGALHGEEVPFALDRVNATQSNGSPQDQATATVLSSYWTNFAKSGNPNGPGVANWPLDSNDQLLLIDAMGEHAVDGFHRQQLDLLARIAWLQNHASELFAGLAFLLALVVARVTYTLRYRPRETQRIQSK